MTNVQDIKLTSRPQLFDINKNLTNFNSKIYAISKKPFYATIISQYQIDNEDINTNSLLLLVESKNKNDDYQFYENISVDTNSNFQQYYLFIKSNDEDKELDSKIVIETVEIPRSQKLVEQDKQREQQQQQQKQQLMQKQQEEKPLLSKIFTLKNILYVVIIICIVLLLYYFFTKSDKKDKTKNPVISNSPTSVTEVSAKSSPPSIKSELVNPKKKAQLKSDIPSVKTEVTSSNATNSANISQTNVSRQQNSSVSERNVSFKRSPNSYKYERLRNFLSSK